ncbi:TetR/AcrR family transcriptional regulator [Ketobacter sp. MCCC 1A13808]|uniref:TetR/AcrR family transcriptional regulator n=1 Tax=Ketobacter sp. MCCC 1A13808 TaxID=2602738 RepID=UPI000F1F1B09|nr:TetR/AcrR family transcriptional regulator [Ketobacter sp. MCCC 1A13808]MVF11004.1 TetR/AcrR family transcriptional regulator [Ketobacter sp. MCCC 1A13808]RLP56390.1 MAG: TetR/AcrR family transcriptional regulator [Ketobacter sp.]
MDENPERRARILNAARDVFARQGFRNSEVKSIATLAGVGKATIYKHFDSKEALLLSVVRSDLQAIRDIALTHLVGPGHPLKRFETTCFAIADYLDQNRNFSLVLIREAGEFMEDIQRLRQQVVGENQAFADAFFNAMKSEGFLPDIPNHIVLNLLMNLTLGTVYSWTLDKDQDMRSEVETLFQLWREGTE